MKVVCEFLLLVFVLNTKAAPLSSEDLKPLVEISKQLKDVSENLINRLNEPEITQEHEGPESQEQGLPETQGVPDTQELGVPIMPLPDTTPPQSLLDALPNIIENQEKPEELKELEIEQDPSKMNLQETKPDLASMIDEMKAKLPKEIAKIVEGLRKPSEDVFNNMMDKLHNVASDMMKNLPKFADKMGSEMGLGSKEGEEATANVGSEMNTPSLESEMGFSNVGSELNIPRLGSEMDQSLFPTLIGDGLEPEIGNEQTNPEGTVKVVLLN